MKKSVLVKHVYFQHGSSNMGNKTEKGYMKCLPMFDSTNVVNWSKWYEMWLMKKNRNHLGLEGKPERPPQGVAAALGVQT